MSSARVEQAFVANINDHELELQWVEGKWDGTLQVRHLSKAEAEPEISLDRENYDLGFNGVSSDNPITSYFRCSRDTIFSAMSRLPGPFRFVFISVAGWMNQRHLDVIDYFREENRVLREQLGERRMRLSHDQRIRLASNARRVGPSILKRMRPRSSRRMHSSPGTDG